MLTCAWSPRAEGAKTACPSEMTGDYYVILGSTSDKCNCVADLCTDDHKILLQHTLTCGNISLEGPCSISSDADSPQTIQNDDKDKIAFATGPNKIIFENVKMQCAKGAGTLVAIKAGELSIVQSKLDGTTCTGGKAALISNEGATEAVTVTVKDSYLTGSALSLSGDEGTINISDSVIESTSEQTLPSISLNSSAEDAEDDDVVDLEVERSALWSGSASVGVIKLTGPYDASVSNSFLWGGTATPLFTLTSDSDDLPPDLTLTQVTAMGDNADSVLLSGGASVVSESVLIDFSGLGPVGTATDDLWIGANAAPDDWSSATTITDAGVAPWTSSASFCLASTDDFTGTCLHEEPLWPTDSCSDLIRWEGKEYLGLRGMFGAVEIPTDVTDAPDWAAAAGLDEPDSDGDGWPDALDQYQNDINYWRPSWYKVKEDGEGCDYLPNTCIEEVPTGEGWSEDETPASIPDVCSPSGTDSDTSQGDSDTGGDADSPPQASGDTGAPASPADTITWTGGDCRGRGSVTVPAESLFLPGLGLLLAARHARRRQAR